MVTRPKADAERTAATLRACGHDVVVAPLLQIEVVADAQIGAGPWMAILVTSANAAAVTGHKRFSQLRALPVFAVGDRSAQAMRAAGFADVTSADGDVHDLMELVAGRIKRKASLLYLAGADRSGDLAGNLCARGFAVGTAIIYRAIPAGALLPAVVAAVADGVDGVLHFSHRSAAVYVDAMRGTGLDEPGLKRPAHFCMSAQVAEPLVKAAAANVQIAIEPTEAALIELIPAA